MRLRRGTSPVLYELYDRDREIGRLCKAQDGAIVLWLDGFLTSADAASAASHAYSGLLAYRAQSDPTGLHLGDVEIAQLRPTSAAHGAATWSARMPLGSHDTPEIFLLAAARRMWDAVRRAGRGVGQNP